MKLKKGYSSLILAIIIATGLLLLSTWSRAWATPPQDPLRQTAPPPAPAQVITTVSPQTGGTLVSTDQTVTVNVPPGAVPESIILSYVPQSPLATPGPLAPGSFFVDYHIFTLEAYRGGEWLPGFVFGKPITITIKYSDAEAAGLEESQCTIQFFDPFANNKAGAWTPLTTTVDTVNNQASAPVNHLSWFALVCSQAAVVVTPTPAVTPVVPALPRVGDAGLDNVSSAPRILVVVIFGLLLVAVYPLLRDTR
ncbi:MAG: hypothetical protein HYU86_07420 [Chloroflexi bacterium]|nr:hypothetical protein [Chloroflexota bacterium]